MEEKTWLKDHQIFAKLVEIMEKNMANWSVVKTLDIALLLIFLKGTRKEETWIKPLAFHLKKHSLSPV